MAILSWMSLKPGYPATWTLGSCFRSFVGQYMHGPLCHAHKLITALWLHRIYMISSGSHLKIRCLNNCILYVLASHIFLHKRTMFRIHIIRHAWIWCKKKGKQFQRFFSGRDTPANRPFISYWHHCAAAERAKTCRHNEKIFRYESWILFLKPPSRNFSGWKKCIYACDVFLNNHLLFPSEAYNVALWECPSGRDK